MLLKPEAVGTAGFGPVPSKKPTASPMKPKEDDTASDAELMRLMRSPPDALMQLVGRRYVRRCSLFLTSSATHAYVMAAIALSCAHAAERGRDRSASAARWLCRPANRYSTVTINLLKPRRMLFSARSSASTWK